MLRGKQLVSGRLGSGLADSKACGLNCKPELKTLGVGTSREFVLSRPYTDTAGAKKEFLLSVNVRRNVVPLPVQPHGQGVRVPVAREAGWKTLSSQR